MLKREHPQSNGTSDAEGGRAKRRREATHTSADVDVTPADTVERDDETKRQENSTNSGGLKEQGLKLWQTVNEAVNKEGRILSLNFMRRPSKRLYPDYYQLIQQPIALDEIKKRLESDGYSNFEAVKHDFDLCFNNAKQYNMTDSEIWRDANQLSKIVNKTYGQLTHSEEEGENADDGDKKAKSKGPNLTRLIKTRLQKLVDKKDASGRVLSTEFMELPSKKEWPIYYKEIKRPQCLENIFKRIKRKEYYSAAEFAADVELVFSNAMTFNQEHTPIWEDALTLRDCFRALMSDLPSPFTLSEYAKPSNAKIKIKPPQLSAASTKPAVEHIATGPSSIVLRVPATSSGAQAKAAAAENTPSVAPNTSATATTSGEATVAAVTPASRPQAQQIPPAVTPQPTSPGLTHYPNASYLSSIAASATPTMFPAPPINAVTSVSATQRPATPFQGAIPQFKFVFLKVQPSNRLIKLDYRDGVKCWAMRLLSAESSIYIGQPVLLDDEEEESSADEGELDAEGKQEEEQEQEQEQMNVDTEPSKNGRRRGKARLKGKAKLPTKLITAKSKPSQAKTGKIKDTQVQLKLNGVLVKEQDAPKPDANWIVSIPTGSNNMEMGEPGKPTWKVYIERS